MYARINAYKQYLNINIQKLSNKKIEKILIRILNLRVVQTRAILFLKSMSERSGSDKKRL